jgi:uncharacterized protein (DUF1015 family)
MAVCKPFRALRYAPAAGDLSRLLSPPYDVITPAEQTALHAVSPHNAVRLILGEERPGDRDAGNRYTRAREAFLAWRRDGILQQDEAPALYAIQHDFADPGGVRRTRLGVIALLDLASCGEADVLKHERTLAGPKADRTRLLEAVPAALEPIFLVYPDADGMLQRQLKAACAGPPAATARLGGDEIRVWMLTTPALAAAFERHLGAAPLLIADGHHRFEVAMAQRQRRPGLMAYCVSMADSALLVHPIHRLVERPADLQALAAACEIEPAADAAAALRWVLGQGAGQGCFGYAAGTSAACVRVRPEVRERWRTSSGQPPDLAALDVSLLHGLLLPAVGNAPGQVRYTGSPQEVWASLREGTAAGAWLLQGVPLGAIYALARAGQVMPPKSTYFYPKVPSGVTFHPD